ncbi:transcription factor HES-4-B-like [Lineus longissimus]|uniref:transcription factor HES-4-B-like n=1 Tax=Lineus longissimus TaxID=88925 RepID=UPI002B4E5E3C
MSPPSPAMSESRAELRKSNKPLMEKRRRARINASLTQLKGLVLEAMKKDTSRYSKLEKADILDMTVKHLKAMHRQQMSVAMANDPSVVSKYRAGFNECAKEVTRYLNTISGVEPEVRAHLLGHLANCLQGQSVHQQQSMTHQSMQPLRIQIPPVSMGQQQQPRELLQPATAVSSPSTFLVPSPDLSKIGTVQLIPGALPSGEVAYFVPQGQGHTNISQGQGQIPMAHSGVTPVSLASSSYVRQAHLVRTPLTGSEAPSTSSSPDSLRSSPPNLATDIHGSPINTMRYPQYASASLGHSRATFKPISDIAVKQEDPVWRPW